MDLTVIILLTSLSALFSTAAVVCSIISIHYLNKVLFYNEQTKKLMDKLNAAKVEQAKQMLRILHGTKET